MSSRSVRGKSDAEITLMLFNIMPEMEEGRRHIGIYEVVERTMGVRILPQSDKQRGRRPQRGRSRQFQAKVLWCSTLLHVTYMSCTSLSLYLGTCHL